MTTRKLSTLIITAAVMLAFTVFLYSGEEKAKTDFVAGSLLIQGLDPSAVQKITVKSGTESVELTRSGGNFLVASKNNYPADTQRVNDLVIAALEIRCASKITDAKSNHADLGVTDDSSDAAVVQFFDKDGKLLTGVVRGKSVDGGSGQYVRRIDSDTVYATEKFVSFNTSAQQFLDMTLTKVDAPKITRVDVATGNDTYTITQESAGQMALQNIPDGMQPKGRTFESVFRAGSALRFDDVKPAGEVDVNLDNSFTMTLSSGLKYTIKSGKSGDKAWATLSAEAPPVERNISIAVDESKEELEKKEEKIKAAETARKFNERHAPWVYQIATWYADNLAKPLGDLIEPAAGDSGDPAAMNPPGSGVMLPDGFDPSINPADIITLDHPGQVIDLTDEPATPATPADESHEGHDHAVQQGHDHLTTFEEPPPSPASSPTE